MKGSRLTQLRRRAGMSQKELGDLLGVSHYTVSAYEKERSEPSDQIKIKIAKAFNVTSDYLIGVIDDPLPIYGKKSASPSVPETLTEEQRRLLRELIESFN